MGEEIEASNYRDRLEESVRAFAEWIGAAARS
jgi:hypothetical protein